MSDAPSALRTFLIADIRGYTRYTEEYGDEAAAELASDFAELVADGVQAHDGQLVELRGDEALAVFTSARQAIRAAVDCKRGSGTRQGRVGIRSRWVWVSTPERQSRSMTGASAARHSTSLRVSVDERMAEMFSSAHRPSGSLANSVVSSTATEAACV